MAGRPPTSASSGAPDTRPSLATLGATVAHAVAARPGAVVTVAHPGGAEQLVLDTIRAALGRLDVRTVVVGRTGRVGDLTPPGAEQVLVVAEAQWATGEALAELAEPRPDGGAVVLLHRRGMPPSRSLALAQLAARRADAALTLGPSTAAEVRAATGLSAAEAERRVALTAGRCDLLAAVELDGSLLHEVTARLSVLDPTVRHAAELLAHGLAADRVDALVDRAGGTVEALVVEGLLDEPEPGTVTLLDGIAEAIRSVTTGARRAAVVDVLSRDDSGVHATDLAAVLAAANDRSETAGHVYARAATQLASLDPVAALRWVVLAHEAGVDTPELSLAEADAALGAGDPHRALAVLEHARSAVPAGEAALVRAAAWVAIGDLDTAADALASTDLAALAGWARVGAGRAPSDSPATDVPATDASPAAADAAASLAEAVATWLAGDADACTDAVRHAVLRHRADPDGDRWPATPELAGALLHAQLGQVERAERLVLDALAERRGGRAQHRAQLLASAWLAATRGRLDDAAGVLDGLGDETLSPHDALWRAGVACSIALRDADADALVPSAADAIRVAEAAGRHLYDLGILTDIAAAAARAGIGSADELLGPAERAVARLGDPTPLRSDLAWARLRVALCCDDPAPVVAAARTLLALDTPAAHRLRRDVAAAIVEVDRGRIDAAEVERVSRELADAGAPHEAARLCGVAAVRTDSEADARRLLKHSRLFRTQRARLKRAEGVDRDVVRLSEQETRVAQLVLEGRTHREIGAGLFISAKTVEHHVAHIRTKLGAGSRAELLAAIREYLSTADRPTA